MKILGYLGAFAVGIWAMSDGWASLRATWQSPDVSGALATLGYLGVFVAAFLYLGYWIYAADRAAGRIQRPIKLYERFFRDR